ncbi:MAG: energy-coupled thiamine transporter ThiT [Caldisericia bacterium]|jgi:thiamine transporter|nr:energy-coupled thiamine transporter ThiT [Caldisericia bacterium]
MKVKFLSIKEITEIGILSALGLLLAYLSKIFFQMPQGGNIGLDMIPVFFLSLKRGIKSGIILGAIVGFLLLLTDYFVIHPFQLLLDYPFAHMALGLAGLSVFKNRYWILGVIVGAFGRFIFHYISGILYFTQFAPKGMNVHFYVASYILSHLIPGTIVAILVLYLLRRRKEIWRI